MGGGPRTDEEQVPLAGRAARGTQDLFLGAVQNLPEGVKKPVRQVAGRILTNTVLPSDYTRSWDDEDASKLHEILRLFAPDKLGGTLKGIARDEPVYNTENVMPGYGEAAMRAGRTLFREYFDLPSQDKEKTFIKDDKKFRINPETTNEAALDALQRFRSAKPNEDTPFGKKDPRTGYTYLGGTYFRGQPDPWNFDVPAEELKKRKPLSAQYFGRQLLESIGRPAILQTDELFNPPPNEDMLSYMFMPEWDVDEAFRR